MIDFVNARFDVPSIQQKLGGESFTLHRRGLGHHYAMQDVVRQIQQVSDETIIDLIFQFLRYATDFNEAFLNGLSPVEFAELFSSSYELNLPKEPMLWMQFKSKESKSESTDYTNRRLSTLVHLLAEYYHWTDDYIMQLPPESVYCYAQEILLARHEDREFRYSLSEVAYDKNGKYKPYDKLPWDTEYVTKLSKEEPTKAALPDFAKPDGEIIDLTRKKIRARSATQV